MSRPFRRRGPLQQPEAAGWPNMTPMVDVVMVILIFFMASTAFLGPEWFLVTGLPRVETGPDPAGGDPYALPAAQFIVRMERGGVGETVASGIGEGTIGLGAMRERIAELGRRTGGTGVAIVIAPAAEVPYQDVVAVHDACAAAGVRKVGLLPAEPRERVDP